MNSFLLALLFVPLLVVWGLSVRRLLWSRGALGRTVAFIPLAALAYLLYTDQNPTDSFFRECFTSVTGHPFPTGGRLLYKEFYTAGNGDTSLCALFEVPQSTYIQLRNLIPPATSTFRSTCADGVLQQRGGSGIAAETAYNLAPDENYYWALVDGRPEVVVSYSLW